MPGSQTKISDPILTIATWISVISLLTGPIYWLPGIPITAISLLKDGLLALFVLVMLVRQVLSRDSSFLPFLLLYQGDLFLIGIVFASFGVMNSAEPLASFLYWARYVLTFGLYFCVYRLLSLSSVHRERLQYLLLLPVFISVFYMLLVTAGLFPKIPPPSEFSEGLNQIFGTQIIGFSYRRNVMCQSIAYIWPVCFYHFIPIARGSTSKFRLIWGFMCLLLFAAAVISTARGGLLLIVVVSVFGLVLSIRNARTLLILVSVTTFLSLAIVTVISNSDSLNLYKMIVLRDFSPRKGKRSEADNLSSGRVSNYAMGLKLFQENFVTGIGFGQFSKIAEDDLDSGRFIHNLYLSIGVEAGILAAFCIFLFNLWQAVRWTIFVVRNRNQLETSVFVWHGILLINFGETFFQPGSMFSALHVALPFWFSIGALCAYKRSYDMKPSISRPLPPSLGDESFRTVST